MRRYEQLRKEARAFFAEARAIQQAAETENRELTDDETKSFDAKLAAGKAKMAEAAREQELAEQEALVTGQALNPGTPVTTADGRSSSDLGADAAQGAQSAATATADRPGGNGQAPAGIGLSRPAVARDEREEGRMGFRNVGEFYLAVVNFRSEGRWDQRLEGLRYSQAASGASQGQPSKGGMLVPPTFATDVWDGLMNEDLNLLPRTDNYTVTGESITFPANAETDRSSGSLFGGVAANWLAEAGQIPSSQPEFRQMRLEPQELAVLIYATGKLLQNSAVALEEYLSRAARETIMFEVNDAIYRGDGAGKPLGLLNSNALVTVAKEGGQAADTVEYANIVKMYARLHSARRMNAVWLINQDVEPQLYSIVDPSDNVPMFIPPGRLSDAPFGRLLGRPVIPFEHCSTLGDLGDIMFVDLSAYATGTRAGGGINEARSPHLRFDFNEEAFRFIFEIDGKTWLNAALTPAQSAATLSPYVTLAARA